ncbi:MAG: cytidyltransferase [Desulfurococcales archaeon ex4484_204]|nr:MAG: cytidyltransferase [Desulfurococcales archaeon ex4484_204]
MSTVGSYEVASRVWTYIDMVKKVINEAKETFKGNDAQKEVLKQAILYLKDAEYYYGVKDYITALSCVSYAEGLIDALRAEGVIKVSWVRKRPRKVLTGGTFDILHPGHIYYLSEAYKMGLVYVVLATDNNVKRIKGREPIMSQASRLNVVSSIKYVYEAFIGDEEDFTKSIVRVKPDIILLGPDQPIDESKLLRDVEAKGVKVNIMRLPKRIGNEDTSTTGIIRKIINKYCRCESH